MISMLPKWYANIFSQRIMTGALYAIPSSGFFTIIRVLHVDRRGVHVRIYSNRFEDIPASLDESELFIVMVDRKPGVEFGIGHVPLSKRTFRSWKPKFVQASTVSKDDLGGYHLWKDAHGGYF